MTPTEESSEPKPLKLLRTEVGELFDVDLSSMPLTRDQWRREVESIGRTHAALMADERARTAAWRACASQLAEALNRTLTNLDLVLQRGEARAIAECRAEASAALAEYRRLSELTP